MHTQLMLSTTHMCLHTLICAFTDCMHTYAYLVGLEVVVWEEVLVVEVLVGDQEGGLVEGLGADLVVVQEAEDEAVDP